MALDALDRMRAIAASRTGKVSVEEEDAIDRIRALRGQKSPGLVRQMTDAATREGSFDAPELPFTIAKNGRAVNLGRMLSAAQFAKLPVQQIVNKQLGLRVQYEPETGAPFIDITPQDGISVFPDVDEEGTQAPNQPLQGRFYLNKPGLSATDVGNVLEQGAAVGAGLVPALRATSLLGRGVAMALGEGGASIGQDVVAQGAGSELPIDQKRAVLAAGLSIAGEFALPAITNFLRSVFSTKAFVRDGVLTPKGENFLREAGIEPEEVTPDFAAAFSDMTSVGADPAAVSRVAQARSLDTPVPLTRGQATGGLQQLKDEQQARKLGKGPEAGERMLAFDKEQQAALAANADALQGEVRERGVGAQAAALKAEEEKVLFRANVDEAYAAARQERAFLPQDVIKGLKKDIRGILKEKALLPRQTTPKVVQALRGLSQLQRRARPIKEAEGDFVAMKQIEGYRQDLQVFIDDVGFNSTQGKALREIRSALDSHLELAIDHALVTGDQNALKMFKDARGLSKVFRERFSDSAILKKFVDADIDQRTAAKVLFGLGGTPGKDGAKGAINKLRVILGENSPEFEGLKSEALGIVFDKARTADGFSAQTLVTQVDKFLKEHELAGALFSKAELLKLKRFRNVAHSTLTPKRLADPGTAATLLNSLFGRVMGPGRVQSFIANKIESFGKAEAGKRFVEESISAPLIPRTRPLARATGAAAGAGAARSEELNEDFTGSVGRGLSGARSALGSAIEQFGGSIK